MKRATGWVGVVLGVVLAVVGAALMIVLGPDSRITTGPHVIETDGTVVVTAPRVITWTGVRIDVLAELPAQKPVFVGLGNTVDVQSLVGGTQRVEISEFTTPWKPTYASRDGRPVVQGAPTALDWWFADSAGLGGASISTDLPDEPVSLAIISVGASSLSGLKVTLAYGIKGGFVKGAGLLLLGVGAVIGALTLRRGGGFEVVDEAEPEPEPEPEKVREPLAERVIYVFVDEDGIEREVGADELDEFEIVDDGDTSDGGGSR